MPDPRRARGEGYRGGRGNPWEQAERGLERPEMTDPSWEWQPAVAAPAAPAAPRALTEEEQYRQMLRDFIKRMQADLDPNDPEVQRYTAQAVNASQRAAQASGIRGGLGVAATQRNVAAGMVPLSQFRQQQAAVGLGMLGQDLSNAAQRQIQAAQLAEQQRQFNAAQQYDLQKIRAAYDQAQGAGIGSLIGGGLAAAGTLGAIGLSGGTLAPTLLPALPGLMRAGSQIGGGLGSMGQGNPYNWGNY